MCNKVNSFKATFGMICNFKKLGFFFFKKGTVCDRYNINNTLYDKDILHFNQHHLFAKI